MKSAKKAPSRKPTVRKKIVLKPDLAPPVEPAPTPPEPSAATVPPARPELKPRNKPTKIPSILLEGDPLPPPPVPVKRADRFALSIETDAPSSAKSSRGGSLPESYGTNRLLLAARDPHWLYAHWDFPPGQQSQYQSLSATGHLSLRVHRESFDAPAEQQIDLHSDSTHWFVPAAVAGARYVAEIGYYQANGAWHQVAASSATLTPPESPSEDSGARFATIPIGVPFKRLVTLVKEALCENPPLADALGRLKIESGGALPVPAPARPDSWTAAQEAALARVISLDPARRVWMGSLEITELIRRQLEDSAARPAPGSQPPSPGPAGLSSVAVALPSSPTVSAPRKPGNGFWFNVNAELIIYGATEPNAVVTIGGRTIRLRADGTFSFRFVLPDGEYELPASATSADGTETRAARLEFRRRTQYQGEVGAHPQDPKLKSPSPEGLA